MPSLMFQFRERRDARRLTPLPLPGDHLAEFDGGWIVVDGHNDGEVTVVTLQHEDDEGDEAQEPESPEEAPEQSDDPSWPGPIEEQEPPPLFAA